MNRWIEVGPRARPARPRSTRRVSPATLVVVIMLALVGGARGQEGWPPPEPPGLPPPPGGGLPPPGAPGAAYTPYAPPRLSRTDIETGIRRRVATIPGRKPAGPRCQGAGCPSALPAEVEAQTQRNTEPVLASGAFIVDETLVSLPGWGVPYELKVFYRSDIDHRTPLGDGWTHNYNLRILAGEPPCGAGELPSVYFVTGQLSTVKFTYSSTSTTNGQPDDLYLAPGVPMQLHRTDEWVLRDGTGVSHHFRLPDGTLSLIADAAGNALRVDWETDDDEPRVSHVTDTTGRVIYYNYVPLRFALGTGIQYETVHALRCVGLSQRCDDPAQPPLASFAMSVTPDEIVPPTPGPPSFELTRILDGAGHGPTYEYFTWPDTWTNSTYVPDAHLFASCATTCGRPEDDCHNYDLCTREIDYEARVWCRPIETPLEGATLAEAHLCSNECLRNCFPRLWEEDRYESEYPCRPFQIVGENPTDEIWCGSIAVYGYCGQNTAHLGEPFCQQYAPDPERSCKPTATAGCYYFPSGSCKTIAGRCVDIYKSELRRTLWPTGAIVVAPRDDRL